MSTTTKIPGNKAVPYMQDEINAVYNESMRKKFEGRDRYPNSMMYGMRK